MAKKMPETEEEKEYRKIQYKFRATGSIALGVLLTGAIFYHLVQHLSWLNAFYFSTITLTTVGYGDIVPTSDAAKLFTIFYVIVGIGILATFANLLIQNAVARRELKASQRNKPSTDKS